MSLDREVPKVPAWFQDGFHRFLTPFLRRHFHAIAVDRECSLGRRQEQALDPDLPVIVFANHPSWWDPLVAHFLNRKLLPERQFFAPIDAEALEQYRVFGKLGFYGVRMNRASGAAEFLKRSTAILETPRTAIWITPEGRFSDPRDHSAELMPGLAHLASRLSRGYVVPMALEYVFWDERLPVCLARFGEAIDLSKQTELGKEQWGDFLTTRLRRTQSDLASKSMTRSSEGFDDLIRGSVGAGMFYDSFRRVGAWARGRRFRSRHGNQFE